MIACDDFIWNVKKVRKDNETANVNDVQRTPPLITEQHLNS